jgi:molybdopterin-guanine dinucleotide biosynthesis protein A
MLAGIFVGGRGSRMGGVAKGLMVAPDGRPIVERTLAILRELGIEGVLVGEHAAYGDVGLGALPDVPNIEGPLGGLLALLDYGAAKRHEQVLALACDMPLVEAGVLHRLVTAPPAPIVAPRRAYWEPLFARYDVALVTLVRDYACGGGRSLQSLFALAGATELELSPAEEKTLVDWDLPTDVPRAGSRTQ